MSFNNVLPAWCLMPFRVIFDSPHSSLNDGFEAKEDAINYQAKYSDYDSEILED